MQPPAFCPMLKMKYKLLIAYDGTHYGGWQRQSNSPCIQAFIEDVLKRILQKPITLIGSGRTDAGVHALAQVAHFSCDAAIPLEKTLASLNALLPADIRILSLEPVSDSFHARYSATGKIYHYRLHLGATIDPFKRRYAYHVPHSVDTQLLKKAATYFVGTHDFSAFANKASQGSAANNAVRTLFRLDIVEEEGGLRLEFEGNGFLYKMVRNIVGTLLDVCANKIALHNIPELIQLKDRKKTGRAAPPHGLHLIAVYYANQ